jgi:hypothetical protein
VTHKRERYYVTVDRPDHISATEMRQQIKMAVNIIPGTSVRGDPWFQVDLNATVIHEPVEDHERRSQPQPRRWGEVALEQMPKRMEQS